MRKQIHATIKEITDKEDKENIAKEILFDLPQWFGLIESTKQYIEEGKKLPFFSCFKEERAVGFLVLRETGKATLEIYVMGVQQRYHRKGIGKALVQAAQQYGKERGYSFLQVKTVKAGCYEHYDETNAFYIQQGFQEFECFPKLWDAWNPCQIYVKGL